MRTGALAVLPNESQRIFNGGVAQPIGVQVGRAQHEVLVHVLGILGVRVAVGPQVRRHACRAARRRRPRPGNRRWCVPLCSDGGETEADAAARRPGSTPARRPVPSGRRHCCADGPCTSLSTVPLASKNVSVIVPLSAGVSPAERTRPPNTRLRFCVSISAGMDACRRSDRWSGRAS